MVMNKRAQFFILSAVIIAAIIVGFVGIKNYAQTGQAPQKFYFYSEQLEKETGAVVDYALYTGSGGELIEQFLQRGIQNAQQNNPGLEVYACYTNATNSSQLICINNGSSQVKVKTGTMNSFSTINGTQAINTIISTTGQKECGFNILGGPYLCTGNKCCLDDSLPIAQRCTIEACTIVTSESKGCSGSCKTTLNLTSTEKNITMQLANGISYTIPINSPLIQSNQFYFIFQINTSAGTYVDVSGDSLKASSATAGIPISLTNSG